MTLNNTDHGDIFAELGVGGVTDPASAAAIDDVLSGDIAPQSEAEIQEEEARLEALDIEITQVEGPWFLALGVQPPIIAARWIPGRGWDVTIMDGDGARFIDPRKRNLLHKAITIAMRRHERARTLSHVKGTQRDDRQRRLEIESAIAKSKADGTYIEYPGQKF